MKETTKQDNYIWLAIVSLVFVVLTIPYLYLSFFGTIAQDDLAILLLLGRIPSDNFFQREYLFARDYYMIWQGSYFTNLLFQPFLLPFYSIGNTAIQLEMFLGIILYLIAFFYMIYEITQKISDSRLECSIISLIILSSCFAIIVFHSLCTKDVFYWVTGIIAYPIPLSLGYISIALLFGENASKFRILFSAILAFLSCGGSSNVAAVICFMTLVLTVLVVYHHRKCVKELVVFATALIGALINVAAPGNYVRYRGTPDGNNVLVAFSMSFKAVVDRYKSLSSCLIIVFCVLSLILFVYNNDGIMQRVRRIEYINPLFLACILFLGEIIVDFPVFLGAGFLSERNLFVAKNVFSLFTIALILDTLGYFEVRYNLSKRINANALLTAFIISLCSIILFIVFDNKENECPYIIARDIIEGKQFDYKRANNYVLDTINNSPRGGDVIIEVENYPIIDYMKGMGVNEDPENWVNRHIRDLYGFNSVSIIYK